MFKTRLISGIVLVLIAFGLLYTGGYVLAAALGIISLIGMFELNRTVKSEKSPLAAAAYLAAVVYYMLLMMAKDATVDTLPVIFFVAFLIVLMAVYVFSFPKYEAGQVMTAFFSLIYVAVMLSYIYRTRLMGGGKLLVWLVFLSSWGCDTSAYCVGMLLGKHKLAPVLSPKKSIEGAVGGVIGSALLGLAYGAYFGHCMEEVANPMAACAIACAIAAVISQIGDLAASAIKRNHNIKDYGHLIPGHGGILDRFDSMIFTAPAIYFAVTFLK